MDVGGSRTYELELWSSSGVALADISSIANKRSYTMERNKEESLTFELDLNEFEAFAASIGVHPRTLLQPYQTDVRVKRNGSYLFGTQIVAAPIKISPTSQVITVRCTGYLNLLADRYVTITYTGQDAVNIAADLITQTQSQTNGSVGITIDSSRYLTGVLRDRTYSLTNVKTAIQDLSKLVGSRFDFNFTYDKVFHTYQQIGAVRSDVTYLYGGAGSNINGLYDENTATTIYNRIIGLGSGFGSDQLSTIQNDNVSQLANYLREDIKQYNGVIQQQTLDQNAAADLALEKDRLEIPQITITGNNIPSNFFSVGDRIPIKTVGHPYLDPLNGLYRIERLDVSLDDNDFETVMAYFDNFAVS